MTEDIQLWKEAQTKDPTIQATLQQLKKQPKRRPGYTQTPQGLLMYEDKGQRKLVVPTSMRQKVLATCHDEPTKGHIGIHKTLALVKERYLWKGMGQDVEQYVCSCPVCQIMKSDHQKKAGLLQPIPIPIRKLEQITTELVTDLPASDGYTAVVVFFNRLTKMVHFCPCTKEITAY